MAKCNCTPTATAAENRAYEARIRALGGWRSPAAKAWIEAEHQAYLATRNACRAQHGPTAVNSGCCAVAAAMLAGLGGAVWGAAELVRVMLA